MVPSPSGRSPSGPRPRSRPAGVEALAGNLTVVGKVTIAPTTGHMTYYQGGNITVQPGGHLTVVNTSLVFVQFVGHTGTLADRLRYIYGLWDYGNLTLVNSTITTDLGLLNPFPFLNIWVNNGSLELTNSTLAFAGTVNVTGPSANVWASASRIVPNPNASVLASGESNASGADLAITQSLVDVSQYAPSISVENGAHVTLIGCVEQGTYAAGPNPTAPPGLTPVNATTPPGGWLVNGTLAADVTGFQTPSNDSAALALEGDVPQDSCRLGEPRLPRDGDRPSEQLQVLLGEHVVAAPSDPVHERREQPQRAVAERGDPGDQPPRDGRLPGRGGDPGER